MFTRFPIPSLNKVVTAIHTETGKAYIITANATHNYNSDILTRYEYPQFFKHYKGAIYYAVDIKVINETDHVILYCCKDNKWWLLPLDMFEDSISDIMPRFIPEFATRLKDSSSSL